MTDLTERTNTRVSFFQINRIVVDEKTSCDVSRRVVGPAWTARVPDLASEL